MYLPSLPFPPPPFAAGGVVEGKRLLNAPWHGQQQDLLFREEKTSAQRGGGREGKGLTAFSALDDEGFLCFLPSFLPPSFLPLS